MSRSIPQVEALVARLPITVDNEWVFEALLRLPFDIYRPILDLLFEGMIVPEDLVLPRGSVETGVNLTDDAQLVRDIRARTTPQGDLLQTCIRLLAGHAPNAVAFERDTTSLSLEGAVYVPGELGHVGSDSAAVTPTPTDLDRAGDLARAQKDLQLRFAAVMHPTID